MSKPLITWNKETAPLCVTPELRDLYAQYSYEYGGTLEGVPRLNPDDHVWRIEIEAEVAGYAWITDSTAASLDPGHYVMVAIFDRFRERGACGFALDQLEREARDLSLPALLAHVNGNSEVTGARVRCALLSRGYVLRRPARTQDGIGMYESYQQLDNVAFVKECPSPIILEKDL